MKAQVLHKYNPKMDEKVWVTEQEMPDPKLEKSSDVIVKIGAAGVCRTDLHIIEGVWEHIQDPKGDLLPMVMGHENAGWVEEVGKDVVGFKKGDPVILHPIISGTDGTCLSCRRGLDQHAEDGAFPGLNIKEGGYAELLKTSTDLSKLKNNKVKLGIRSEFIKIAENQKENVISVDVEKVEDLGNYKLLTAKIGNLTIKSKINRETEVSSEKVNLHIPSEKCCVYEDEKLI